MIPSPNSSTVSSAASSSAESTLRLIASLPAPEGLEQRVHESLRSAPPTSRIIAWPTTLRPGSDWMRTAAAAASVFVVAGGGWGVYSRVVPGQTANPIPPRAVVLPPRVAGSGGFSSAGAMRTPQTLNGPVVVQPVTVPAAQPKALKKPRPGSAASAAHPAHPVAAQSGSVQPTTPAAK